MANLIDLSRLPPHEFLAWLKNPNNIFTGNMMVMGKPYYSNTFSFYNVDINVGFPPLSFVPNFLCSLPPFYKFFKYLIPQV